MAPVLYMMDHSPPSRAAMMTASAIGLDLEFRVVNLLKREQLSPEFVKVNPQHTIPVLVDGELTICDSHAIMGYFIQKYAEDDSLYPKDPEKRAMVDQRLHFNGSVLFPNMAAIFYPMILEGVRDIPEKKRTSVEKSYDLLEYFLSRTQWIALDDLSIADLSLVATISALDVFVPVDLTKYKKIAAWIKKCEELPYYSINKNGADSFRTSVYAKFGKKF